VHWTSLDELAQRTVELADDPARTAVLSGAATQRALDFSARAFADRLTGYLASDVDRVAG
jgi:hypothetical protein